MDLRRIEVFCRVVELRNFSRAAESLQLSQPTVSEHVRLLEAAIGERLLDRTAREALPTGAGELLFRYGQRLLRLRDEALQALAQYQGRLAGRLRVGAGTIPGTYLLPALLEGFCATCPEILLSLRIAGSGEVTRAVLAGELELGVIGAPPAEARLAATPLFSDELVLCVPPDHPWAGRAGLSPQELVEAPFVLREPGSGTRTVTEEFLTAEGVATSRLQVVAELDSTEAVKQAIKAGAGVSILSSRAIAEELAHGTLATVPLAGFHLERSFHLIQRRNRELSPLARAFHDYLIRRAAT